MPTLETSVENLHKQQRDRRTPKQFSEQIDSLATELFNAQPTSVTLPKDIFREMLISFQADHGKTLLELENKINLLRDSQGNIKIKFKTQQHEAPPALDL